MHEKGLELATNTIKRGAHMKRAQDLPMTTIIIAVLSMIVLVVLIGLFIRQSGNVGRQYTDISQQVTTDTGDNCQSLIKGTSCVLTDRCAVEKRQPGTYPDCAAKSTNGKTYVCCETF